MSLNLLIKNKFLQKNLIVSLNRIKQLTNNMSGCHTNANSDKWFTKGVQVTDVPEGVLKGISDRFNGITIDSLNEDIAIDKFSQYLNKSLCYWDQVKRRNIWFRVNLKHSDWIPLLVKEGFKYHHALNEYVMMYKWLPKDESVNIPPYAHTMLGVGALVINNKNEILAVSEKNALIKDSWKLPGGYVEPGEDIMDAAIREVMEETNIKTRFESLIALRHAHNCGFGCSDLYVVVSLIPDSIDIIKCDREIAQCKWMKVEDFLTDANVHETNRNFVHTYLKNKELGIEIINHEEIHTILKRRYCLFKAQAITTNGKTKL